MAIFLWIVQALLALIFVITGSFKFFQSKEKIIASGGTWAEDFHPAIIKSIAASELVSGLLVIIPKIIGSQKMLSHVGATWIAIVMTGAIVVHFKRKEIPHALINTVFLIMAIYVSYSCRPM
jgi:uncharacterized membrane protein YphA (DoxX/SURF4 family)